MFLEEQEHISDEFYFYLIKGNAGSGKSVLLKRIAFEAANELRSAADDLSGCAKRHDYTNDCRSRYRETKYKFEQYESAVSEASGDCS